MMEKLVQGEIFKSNGSRLDQMLLLQQRGAG